MYNFKELVKTSLSTISNLTFTLFIVNERKNAFVNYLLRLYNQLAQN